MPMGPDLYSLATQFAAGVLVLILPGYIWLSWFPPTYIGFLPRLAEMIGLSLALNALAGLALFLLGIQASPESVVVVFTVLGLLGAISLAIELRHVLFRLRIQFRRWRSGLGDDLQPEAAAPVQEAAKRSAISPGVFALAGLAVLGAIIIWRFVQVRDLVLPAWVNSVHHVLIVKLILENGSIPASFAPYMPVPFYYHFGFHTSAALFALLAGLSPAQAVLTLGQLINALVALGIFRLGLAIWGDWRRAGITALLVGFVLQMPAYYSDLGPVHTLIRVDPACRSHGRGGGDRRAGRIAPPARPAWLSSQRGFCLRIISPHCSWPCFWGSSA